jgi:hypothetical protein
MQEEDEQVAQLTKIGFAEDAAHRIVALAPSALSRAVIEEMGDLKWSPTVSIGDRDFRLDRQPEYEALLLLARLHRKHGFFDQESFKTVVQSSAEINAISKALNAREELNGGTIATALINAGVADYLLP